MFSFRWMWWLIAATTATLSVWSIPSETLAYAGLGSCSKAGPFSAARPDVQCTASIYHVYGVWPLVWVGLFIVAPSVVAAAATSWWVSWMTVVAFAALSFYGLAHITQIQSMFAAAIPLTVISFLVAAVHTAVRLVSGPTRPSGSLALDAGGLDERATTPSAHLPRDG